LKEKCVPWLYEFCGLKVHLCGKSCAYASISIYIYITGKTYMYNDFLRKLTNAQEFIYPLHEPTNLL
jgi:hypothetical protein